jgi:tripartite-type tricarboxylate transporter receptor subunit TctC
MNWQAMWPPKKRPDAIVQRSLSDARKVLADQHIQAQLGEKG